MLKDDRNEVRLRALKLKVKIPSLLQKHKDGLTFEEVKTRLKESLRVSVWTALRDLEKDGAIQTDGHTWKLKTEKSTSE